MSLDTAVTGSALGSNRLDVEAIRKDFPILERRLADDRPLVYLDSANTSQKPRQVLDTLRNHYERHNANVARAVHQLGEEATAAFEAARDTLAAFVKAPSRDEIIFTRGVTEGLNLVANVLAWADPPYGVGPGDEVVITEMEHHSNIVPWQLLTQRTGATLRWFGITDEGRMDLSNLDDLITEDAVGTYEGDANAGQADRLDDGAGGAAVLGDELGDGVHRGLRQFRRGRGGVRLLGIGAHDSTILVGSPEATPGMD